ncbi:MAG: hypothetical protein IPM01_18850 [Burkholderiaceae bacterium]|nr:hypothetical protein [Burkholderiaceae bacterium]
MLQPQVTVTASAAKFMQRMVRFSEHPTGGFRLTVSPGGCSGYASGLKMRRGGTRAGGLRTPGQLIPDSLCLLLSRVMLDGVTAVDFADTPTPERSDLLQSEPGRLVPF